MLNRKLKLNPDLFKRGGEKKSTRDGFGQGLVLAGEKNDQVVVLTADLQESTRCTEFFKRFPERFFEVGVAEQALATIAAGMAAYGKIPFISSFACFSPARNWEQIRTTIALNDVPVKIAGSHAGVNVGADGATHQALEDLALMRTLPRMVVLAPADFEETQKAVLAAVENQQPTYIRFTREPSALITTPETPFNIGQALTFWEDKDPQVAIVVCGPLVSEALLAAKKLSQSKIASLVINLHTIKPIDETAVIRAARTAGAIVTVEEHQLKGGLGSAVAELLTQNWPTPIEMVGINDAFGESGSAKELLEKFGLTAENILKACKKVITRKNA